MKNTMMIASALVIGLVSGGGTVPTERCPMMASMEADQPRLDELASKMNNSTGQARVDAMAELLTALVQQRAMAASMPPAEYRAAPLDIAFRSLPDPPQTGDNTFEVAVKDALGRPVTDAAVTVDLFMPAMPAMGMPDMRSAAKLAHGANGVYRGVGQVFMAGRWEVTISATRGGAEIASRKLIVTAR